MSKQGEIDLSRVVYDKQDERYVARLERELSEARAENATLRAALEKYATKDNWSSFGTFLYSHVFIQDAERHGWEIAERALQESEGSDG